MGRRADGQAALPPILCQRAGPSGRALRQSARPCGRDDRAARVHQDRPPAMPPAAAPPCEAAPPPCSDAPVQIDPTNRRTVLSGRFRSSAMFAKIRVQNRHDSNPRKPQSLPQIRQKSKRFSASQDLWKARSRLSVGFRPLPQTTPKWWRSPR